MFLLGRIKEARDSGLSNTEAVAHGLERTGRIVSSAALLMCIALGTLMVSKITYIKELGLGAVVAVAVDALVVRALLLPALMKLLGRWNWWAPPGLRGLGTRFAEPPATIAGGRSLSPISTVTADIGTPSTSAAVCPITV